MRVSIRKPPQALLESILNGTNVKKSFHGAINLFSHFIRSVTLNIGKRLWKEIISKFCSISSPLSRSLFDYWFVCLSHVLTCNDTCSCSRAVTLKTSDWQGIFVISFFFELTRISLCWCCCVSHHPTLVLIQLCGNTTDHFPVCSRLNCHCDGGGCVPINVSVSYDLQGCFMVVFLKIYGSIALGIKMPKQICFKDGYKQTRGAKCFGF